MAGDIQNVLPFSFDAMVEALIAGGNGRGVTSTPTRDVISAAAGQTSTYTLTVGPQQEILLISRQEIQASPYGPDFTLSLSIDGQAILTDVPLTQPIHLPGADLPQARHQIVYTLTNAAASGNTEVTIDTFGATLSSPTATQIQRIFRVLYDRVLGFLGGGF